MTKAWGGRFSERGGQEAVSFTASLPFDRRLYVEDLEGSVAHARMLAKQGIIGAEEAEAIAAGLKLIKDEIDGGRFPFRLEHEDIHLNIERRLIELIGPVGGKLHTARSRNDQVAVDMHLYLKRQIGEIVSLVRGLQRVVVRRAEEHLGDGGNPPTLMPGYTHLQRAQPILFSQHLMAYFFMLQRDCGRLEDCRRRTDVSPLGAGALAGTTFPIDRQATAQALGFPGVYENSLDAVSDRDYLVEFLGAASLVMVHLSRLAEELVLWSTAEFGFVEMDDAYATGSSIMPQKKNPDVAELVRGKAGRVYGSLMGLLTVLKGLPLAYHTDLQEDKERTFDAIDTVKASLRATAGMLETLRVDRDRMRTTVRQDFSNATDLADYLAKKGLPFREAHEVVGRAVAACLARGCYLADLHLDELRAFSPLIEGDVYGAISPEQCVAARSSRGGTAPEQVRLQIRLAQAMMESAQAP